jgi:hypothetical protein
VLIRFGCALDSRIYGISGHMTELLSRITSNFSTNIMSWFLQSMWFVHINPICQSSTYHPTHPHIIIIIIIIMCIWIWIYRRQQSVSYLNVIWQTDGSMAVCVCVCMYVCMYVCMNCSPNTSCREVTKKFAVWGCSIYLLEMTLHFFIFC